MKFAASFASFLVLSALFFYPLPSRAQVPEELSSYDSSINANDFEFEMTPENPGPRTSVSIRLTSNLVDTNRYQIVWIVNGQVIASGIGRRNITVMTGDYGQETIVAMTITLADSTVTKQIALAPQDATILWEAVDSYVPPFYQGKKLGASEALIRITSIPNFLGGAATASKTAVYNWNRNGSVIPNASGYGRDSILIKHNQIRQMEEIEVRSSSRDGSTTATSKIVIPFFAPRVLFYEENPATGMRSTAAKNSVYFASNATTVVAEPYYFSTPNGNPNALRFQWRMNNNPVSIANTRFPQKLQLQNPGSAGVAQISLSVENIINVFQQAGANLSASFSSGE